MSGVLRTLGGDLVVVDNAAREGALGTTIASVAADEPEDFGAIVLRDSNDAALIGQAADGSVSLRLSLWSLNNAQLHASAAEVRGAFGQYNVLRSTTTVDPVSGQPTQVRFFSYDDADGQTYNALQKRVSFTDTALIDGNEPLPIYAVYGQSNVSDVFGGAPVETAARYPTKHVMFSANSAFNGASSAVLDGSTQQDILPASDAGRTSQSLFIMAATAQEALGVAAEERSQGGLHLCVFEGGQQLPAFEQGTNNYTNLMTAYERAVEVAADYGRSAQVKILTLVQGEAGPFTRSTYDTTLQAIVGDLVTDIKAITGQVADPCVFVWQTNIGAAATANEAQLGQWDATEALTSTTRLVGPMYQFPLVDEGATDIHLTAASRMMQGATEADARRRYLADDFTPVKPVSAIRSGTTVVVTFDGPGALSFDADWVLAATDYGFGWEGASATISSVTITDTLEVTIELSTGEAGVLTYARTRDDQNTWASRRGQLMHQTSTVNPFYTLGYTVPQYIRHYCIVFEMDVS